MLILRYIWYDSPHPPHLGFFFFLFVLALLSGEGIKGGSVSICGDVTLHSSSYQAKRKKTVTEYLHLNEVPHCEDLFRLGDR